MSEYIDIEITVEQASLLKLLLSQVLASKFTEPLGALYEDLLDNEVPDAEANLSIISPILLISPLN